MGFQLLFYAQHLLEIFCCVSSFLKLPFLHLSVLYPDTHQLPIVPFAKATGVQQAISPASAPTICEHL